MRKIRRLLYLNLILVSLALMHAPAALAVDADACRDFFFERTNSRTFAKLETASPHRTELAREKNGDLNAVLKQSKNKKPVENWLKSVYDKEDIIDGGRRLSDGSVVRIQRNRLFLADDRSRNDERLVRVSKTGAVTLVSNDLFKKNGSVHFVEMNVSPDERYVAVKYEKNGSLDKFGVLIFDLKLGQLLPVDNKIETDPGTVDWIGSKLYFQNNAPFVYDLADPQPKPVATDIEISSQEGRFGLTTKEGSAALIDTTGIYRLPSDFQLLEKQKNLHIPLIGSTKDFVFVAGTRGTETTEILRVARPLTGDPVETTTIATLEKGVLRKATITGNRLNLFYSDGVSQFVKIIGTDGQAITTIEVPDELSALAVLTGASDSEIVIRFTSAVTEKKDYVYSLRRKRFEQPLDEIKKDMLTAGGREYETSVEWATSSDGERIPYRTTKLKSLPRNGQNPVFMDVYGGFGVTATFYPSFEVTKADFLSRGGIVAEPALRGGDEFGEPWHEAAKNENKFRTFDDLIATSRSLVANGWTQSRLVIITGTSNGGLTVAGAALRAPDAFGFVIPVNGVQDLLAKERLDEKFYQGWSYEYGNSRTEAYQHLKVISPVEKSSHLSNAPTFLIITGLDDSRVNTAHSFKLKAALDQAHIKNVYLASVKNAGHWLRKVKYQGLIGWRIQSVQWTLIYDYLGWKR